MSDVTPNQGFPFPEENDPPAGHSQMEALAVDLDGKWPIRSRGKSIIDAEQSIVSTGATLAGTPDRIEDLVLPSDGLIFVLAQLQMKITKGTLDGLGSSRLYLDENPVRVSNGGSTTVIVEAELATIDGNVSGLYKDVHTYGGGLYVAEGFGSNVGVPVTTGQVVGGRRAASGANDPSYLGGPLAIFASAGTYDLSLRYTAPGYSGDTKVRNRKLWAWTMPF